MRNHCFSNTRGRRQTMPSKGTTARVSSIRFRALRMLAERGLGQTMATLDRLDRLGKRLRSTTIRTAIMEVRDAVIEAGCKPTGTSRQTH